MNGETWPNGTPGSDAAVERGCTCPRRDNQYGDGAWAFEGGGCSFGWRSIARCMGSRWERRRLMTDSQSFRPWLVLWAFLIGVVLLLLVGMAVNTWTRLDDVQTQLEHIDSHFRAPEPTETSEGVAG